MGGRNLFKAHRECEAFRTRLSHGQSSFSMPSTQNLDKLKALAEAARVIASLVGDVEERRWSVHSLNLLLMLVVSLLGITARCAMAAEKHPSAVAKSPFN
jgi:hypothetical protein